MGNLFEEEPTNIMTITEDFKYIDSDDYEPLFYATESFEKEAERVKFIRAVERTVRSSNEYRAFVKYLKTDLELNYCTVLNKVKSSKNVKMEMHHAPFTLFDICFAVVSKRESEGILLSTFSVAEEVMIQHYNGMIGLVNLSTTMHELVHEGTVTVPKSDIVGNFEVFYDTYGAYLKNETIEKYKSLYGGDNDVKPTKVTSLVDDERLVSNQFKKNLLTSSVNVSEGYDDDR